MTTTLNYYLVCVLIYNGLSYTLTVKGSIILKNKTKEPLWLRQ